MQKKGSTNYKSFDYLKGGKDYKEFKLADELSESYQVTLSETEEQRYKELALNTIIISLHEHPTIFPKDINEVEDYIKEGRIPTAFQGLSHSLWDGVFDNVLDGICNMHSKSGWKWTEIIHDIGMRQNDLVRQDLVIVAKSTDDIRKAHEEGKIALVFTLEGSAMIENEVDRIDILYGLGVRSMGVTYSEANALGSGLKEPNDGGLTVFGKKAVDRMNKVGMLIDCSHSGDQTTLDVIEHSEDPIVLSHTGARSLWGTNRLKPDNVLKACADKGGVIGIEAAPHTTITENNNSHNIESFMEHFEYIKDLVGIDHVAFGPDTLYGDHVGLHDYFRSKLSLSAAQKSQDEFEKVECVEGLENPTEASHNILRWLVKHNYSDEEIKKVLGENILRIAKEVWK